MEITLSGGDLGGSVVEVATEPAVGEVLDFDGLRYRYNGGGQAIFIGAA